MAQLTHFRQHITAYAALALILLSISSIHLFGKLRASSNGDLLNFHLGDVISIDGIENNLSGITWNASTKTLFAVVNSPTLILELDRTGSVLRRIELRNFVDTEGIVHITGRQFAVVQERQRRISHIEIDAQTTTIDATAWPSTEIAGTTDNHSLEGIAWSPQGRFFIAEEKAPRRIHTLTTTSLNAQQTTELGEFSAPLPVRDIAGLHLDQVGDTLLVVSEESNQLLQYSLEGDLLSSLKLSHGPFGAWPFMKQPEGVTMDDKGTIYLVGEPNQLAILHNTGTRRTNTSFK